MDNARVLENFAPSREISPNKTHPAVNMLEQVLAKKDPADLEILKRNYYPGSIATSFKEAATVLLELRPSAQIHGEFSDWLIAKCNEVNPILGSKFDSVAVDTFSGTKEQVIWTFFINKQLLIKTVNSHPDIFLPVLTYEAALDEFRRKALYPKLNDLVIGLVLGYPREDCQVFNDIQREHDKLYGPNPEDLDKNLRSFGFSNRDIWTFKFAESYIKAFQDSNEFVNFLGLKAHPLGIYFRNKLEQLYRKIPGYSEKMNQYLMQQQRVVDYKYGSIMWIAKDEESASRGKAIIEIFQRKIETSGMVRVFDKVASLKPLH